MSRLCVFVIQFVLAVAAHAGFVSFRFPDRFGEVFAGDPNDPGLQGEIQQLRLANQQLRFANQKLHVELQHGIETIPWYSLLLSFLRFGFFPASFPLFRWPPSLLFFWPFPFDICRLVWHFPTFRLFWTRACFSKGHTRAARQLQLSRAQAEISRTSSVHHSCCTKIKPVPTWLQGECSAQV